MLGTAVAVGMLTKPLYIGLLPAVALAVTLAVTRSSLTMRNRFGAAAATVSVAALPVVTYAFVGSTYLDHPYFPNGGGAVAVTAPAESGHSIAREISYVWQLFLPRLPFMQDLIPNVPLVHLWFNGLVGRFGWLDYGFRPSVYTAAHWAAGIMAALAIANLVARRDAIVDRWREVLCYVAALGGVLAAIGIQDYRSTLTGGLPFQQARYLLPLAALYALAFALVARGFGRRYGPLGAVALVTLAAVHTVAAMLLTLERYYA